MSFLTPPLCPQAPNTIIQLDLQTSNPHARRAIHMAIKNAMLSGFTCCTTAAPLALPLTIALHLWIVCSACLTLVFAARGLAHARASGQGRPEALAALVVCALQLSFNLSLALIIIAVLNSSGIPITWLNQ